MNERLGPESQPEVFEQYRLVKDKLFEQEKTSGTRMIVLADVDDTTYSHTKASANTSRYTDALGTKHIPDSRITGRHFYEVIEYINSGKITHVPDILSVRNGTMIYLATRDAFEKKRRGISLSEGDFHEDESYSKYINSLGFDKIGLLKTKPDFESRLAREVPGMWLEHQIADRGQNLEGWGMVTDKNQVIFDMEVPDSQDQVKAQRKALDIAEEMYSGLSIVLMDVGRASQSKLEGVAYGLFLLPPDVGKHTANEHIIKLTGATSACIIGDALNDYTMLTSSYPIDTYRGVVGGSNPILNERLGIEPHPMRMWVVNPLGHEMYVENDLTRIGPESAIEIVNNSYEREVQKYLANQK